MAGPNTTGTPNTEDYNLGRGALYFAELNADDTPKGFRHLGNSPEFTLNVEVETLEHKSSLNGLAVIDKEVTISQTLNVSFQLDEINHENLALVFSGAKATHTNVAVAGFSEYEMVAEGDIELGRWYDIVNSSGERAYDIDTGDLTVKTTNASPVTLTLNTDYTVDTEFGRIFLLSTSTALATAITNVEGLDVTLAAEATASAVREVQGLTTSAVSGQLKFISENPADNDAKQEWNFLKIALKADGDFSLIGDDWTVMSFSGKCETSSDPAYADAKTLIIRSVAA